MKHFSHVHPLSLIEVKVELEKQNKRYEDQELPCIGCLEWILLEDFAYVCTQEDCKGKFFLHRSCAELPHELSHPEHQQHHNLASKKQALALPLDRQQQSPPMLYQRAFDPSRSCRCNVCGENWEGFTYSCSMCEYNVDILCVLKKELRHKSHAHPLLPQRRAADHLFCDACGTKEGKDRSYFCPKPKCTFWIHKTCSLLPHIKTSKNHDHPLSLAYSFPSDYIPYGSNCEFCHEEIPLVHWVYCCLPCRYFYHLKCVDREPVEAQNTSNSEKEKAEKHCGNHSVKLPVTDIFEVNNTLTIRFLEKYGSARELLSEIEHFSHRHPLILSVGTHDAKEMKYEEALICDGCILPIFDSFYGCEECNYFLHAPCAQLPKEIMQPSHIQHPLVLRKLKRSFGYFECNLCKLICNGFFYKCEFCQFGIDLKCALLETVSEMLHDAHRHPLVQNNKRLVNALCNCCSTSIDGPHFGCADDKDCTFKLHYHCALLPREISHFDSFRAYKRDDHPLSLKYPPFSFHPDEFYCGNCEEEIHPKNNWLYICSDECDRSFHCHCILELHKFRNIKFGATLQVHNHRHALRFIIRCGYTPLCDCCGADLYHEMAFECSDCPFYFLCYSCGSKYASKMNSGFEENIAEVYVKLPRARDFMPVGQVGQLIGAFLREHGNIDVNDELSAEMKHFSHEHPLYLSTYNHPAREYDATCGGCESLIFVDRPYYFCCNIDCNYFLHADCARVPNEIPKNPLHPQHSSSFVLLKPSGPLGGSMCRACTNWGRGFFYMCKAKNCDFRLDIHCAMLSSTRSILIKHEAHSAHPLEPIQCPIDRAFDCCIINPRDVSAKEAILHCYRCNFSLHFRCALYPRFAPNNAWHYAFLFGKNVHHHTKYPLILTYKFREFGYYCSECNESFRGP